MQGLSGLALIVSPPSVALETDAGTEQTAAVSHRRNTRALVRGIISAWLLITLVWLAFESELGWSTLPSMSGDDRSDSDSGDNYLKTPLASDCDDDYRFAAPLRALTDSVVFNPRFWGRARNPDCPPPAKTSNHVLKPFTRGRPSIAMNGQVKQKLAKGEVYRSTKYIGKTHTGMGQAVMDVNAPPSEVWRQLLDFNSYPKKVPKVTVCDVYRKKNEGIRSKRIFTKFVSPLAVGYKLRYHVDHTYEPAKNSLTWELDDEKKNDFKEIQGHWHVEPHPDDASKSRVFYEIGLVTPGWLPKWLTDKIANRAVTDATGWLRRESEKAAAQSP